MSFEAKIGKDCAACLEAKADDADVPERSARHMAQACSLPNLC